MLRCAQLSIDVSYRVNQRLFTIYIANRSVDGLGKFNAKFRTGKFRPGIAFTICVNQFHLPKNDHEGLKLVPKMKKWNTNFRLEYMYSIQKNKTTFSDVPLLPEIFRWNDPRNRAPILLFNRVFRKLFCKW